MFINLSLRKKFKTSAFIIIFAFFCDFCFGQVSAEDSGRQILQTSAEINDARELINLGRLIEAEKKIDSNLKKFPRDAQWRYLKAVLLAEFAIIQKNNDYDNTYDSKQKIDIAIVSFERFTEEFPELAEPYNNLAVLYLLQDRPERARLALERAILNNSNYELAYENLGDLYIYLANITYENGLSKLPKSIRLTKKIDHLKSMPLLTRPNIIKKLKK